MRIASIYSGELRTWSHCRKSHDDIFNGHYVDNYFFTHERPENTSGLFVKTPGDFYDAEYNDRFRNHWPESQPFRTLCQWHNNFIAFSMVQKDYDVYVRNRTDIIFKGKPDFHNVQPNTVYIPSGNDFRNGINDQFAYGDYQTMFKYYSVYLNWQTYYREGHYLHTEGMLFEHLQRERVNIVRLDWTNEIIR